MVAALFLPRGSLPVDAWEIGRIGVGRWRGHGSEPGGLAAEEVLVVRGPGGWEVQCHGGNAAADAVFADLVRLGAERVPSGAWHTDGAATVAAEALSLLAAVDAPRGARILCRQLAGALDRELAGIATLVGQGEADSARRRADRLRRAARVGLRLAEPWRVVVSGRVNAGKSSLVNVLAGHARSLVSPRPGTTRDVIETAVVLGGWSVVLVDTAGLRDRDSEASGATERAGIARADNLILTSGSGRIDEEIIRHAKQLNPHVRILARTHTTLEVPRLRRAGAEEAFSGEGEVALALTVRILEGLGATPEQIDRERQRIEAGFRGG